MNLTNGASAASKLKFKEFYDKIFKGLNKAEKEQLNRIIELRRNIQIDNNTDAKGEPRKKHRTGGKEIAEDYLNNLKETNPKLFEKLNSRVNEYFKAYNELLEMSYKEGRVSEEVYNELKNFDYSPRKYMTYLFEQETDQKQSAFELGVSASDIKSLKEGSLDDMFHDAEWLLQASTYSTHKKVFQNKANKALAELAEKNPRF